MTPDEIISVAQAVKDGREIECATLGQSDWGPSGGPKFWNFTRFGYRVKESFGRDFWLVKVGTHGWIEYPCRQSVCDVPQIHVREVLP